VRTMTIVVFLSRKAFFDLQHLARQLGVERGGRSSKHSMSGSSEGRAR
jgi:hypothetical protein